MSQNIPMPERVDQIVASYQARPTALIMVLQEVQQEYSYLPPEALQRISDRMDLVSVCTGTACHVRNSKSILERLERDLAVERGHTSVDGEVTLETVNCVGACALGPVVLVDGKHYGHLTVGEVEKLVEVIRQCPCSAQH